MEGDAREVETTESIVSWWYLFGVAVYIDEFFAYRKGISVDGWHAKDGEIGDAIGL